MQRLEVVERDERAGLLSRPGASFIESSSRRSSASRSGSTGARTMKLDCGVIARYSKTSSPVGS